MTAILACKTKHGKPPVKRRRPLPSRGEEFMVGGRVRVVRQVAHVGGEDLVWVEAPDGKHGTWISPDRLGLKLPAKPKPLPVKPGEFFQHRGKEVAVLQVMHGTPGHPDQALIEETGGEGLPRWAPVTELKPRPKPAKPKVPPHTDSPPQASLRKRYTSGERGTTRLGGGIQAQTEKITLADGSHAVRKQFGDWAAYTASDMADAEELSYRVADVIGGTGAMPVIRTGRKEVVMDYAEKSVVADRWLNQHSNKQALRVFDSRQGLRIGLMDILNDNDDRHGHNYMFIGNKPVPIDNSSTFGIPGGGWPGPFRDALERAIRQGDRPFSTADIKKINDGLFSPALRAQFQQRGHLDWLQKVQGRWIVLKNKMEKAA